MRKLVIFWGKKNKANKALDYSDAPDAEILFVELLNMLFNNEIETYFCRSSMGYLGKNRYKCDYKFNVNGSFDSIDEVVLPDVVWDKSIGINFPIPGEDMNVINSSIYKAVETNKWISYLLYKDYFPKTYLINSKEDLLKIFEISSHDKLVIKPVNGYGGYGVTLVNKENFQFDDKVFEGGHVSLLAQAFIDTGVGIKGIVEGKHDLRLVCLNNQIVISFLRTPKKGDFRSNWAQGGTFSQVLLDKLPQELIDFVTPVIKDIFNKYNNPIFAIDVANTSEGYKIIELTGSAVSFPDAISHERDFFFKELTKRFKKS